MQLQFGEYVSLGKVESILKTCPLVENVCIYGDPARTYCVALVVPERTKLAALAADKLDPSYGDMSFEDQCADERVSKAILKELCGHGRRAGLEKFELPGALTLIQELWTPESGLVTAAFKLKRKPIQDYYQKELKRMYESRSA